MYHVPIGAENPSTVFRDPGQAPEDSDVLPGLDASGWRLSHAGRFLDRGRNPLRDIRDPFYVRQWVQQFRADPAGMSVLRRTLTRTSRDLYWAGDDEVIAQAAHVLISRGRRASETGVTSAAAETLTFGWKRVAGMGVLPPPNRRFWEIKTRFTGARVIRAAELVPGEEFLQDHEALQMEIMQTAHDPEAKAALAEICAAVYGARGEFAAAQASPFWLGEQILRAFREGLLVLVREARRSGGDSSEISEKAAKPPAPSPAPTARKTEEKTWFRMQLLDEDGDPMKGEDYVVVDSAGAHRKGKLDANGQFYIPKILPEGECTINFPNIHLNPLKRK